MVEQLMFWASRVLTELRAGCRRAFDSIRDIAGLERTMVFVSTKAGFLEEAVLARLQVLASAVQLYIHQWGLLCEG